jgi:hypothetical protein
MYAPYIKQEEPLKTECQHFLDCIKHGTTPISCGRRGTELVRILEASSESLRSGGGAINFEKSADGVIRTAIKKDALSITLPKASRSDVRANARSAQASRKNRLQILLDGSGHGHGHGTGNGNGHSNGNGR